MHFDISGVIINPGDCIVADDDGVIVIATDAEIVLERAEASVAIEQRIIGHIRRGQKVREVVQAALANARRALYVKQERRQGMG